MLKTYKTPSHSFWDLPSKRDEMLTVGAGLLFGFALIAITEKSSILSDISSKVKELVQSFFSTKSTGSEAATGTGSFFGGSASSSSLSTSRKISLSNGFFSLEDIIPVAERLPFVPEGGVLLHGLKNSGHNICWLNSLVSFLARNEVYDRVFFPAVKAAKYKKLEDENLENLRRIFFALITELRDPSDPSTPGKRKKIESIQQRLVEGMRELEKNEKKYKLNDLSIGVGFNDPIPYLRFFCGAFGLQITAREDEVAEALRKWPKSVIGYKRDQVSTGTGDSQEREQADFFITFSLVGKIFNKKGIVDVPLAIQNLLCETEDSAPTKDGGDRPRFKGVQFTNLPETLVIVPERSLESGLFSHAIMPPGFQLTQSKKGPGGKLIPEKKVKYGLVSCVEHSANFHFTSLHLTSGMVQGRPNILELDDENVRVISDRNRVKSKFERMQNSGQIYAYRAVSEEEITS
jgi:hypothetical protein